MGERVKRLTLEPDDDMRWIYDTTHRDYSSKEAEWLRGRRAAALRSAPEWMIREAKFNDAMRESGKETKATPGE
jgi:hypothetical protein